MTAPEGRDPALIADPVRQVEDWSAHLWHTSQHNRMVVGLAGRLQTLANEMRVAAGLEEFGWNTSFPDERFGECSVHVEGCAGQETHPEAPPTMGDVASVARYLTEHSDGPDLCFILTEDNGSFCGRTLPCAEHNDGEETWPMKGLSDIHLRHWQVCNCLADKAICCVPDCLCKSAQRDGDDHG